MSECNPSDDSNVAVSKVLESKLRNGARHASSPCFVPASDHFMGDYLNVEVTDVLSKRGLTEPAA